MSKNDVSKLKKMVGWLGFDQTTGKYGINVLMYLICTTLLLVNATLLVIYKWKNVDTRVEAIKGLVQYLICSSYFVALACDWNNSMRLIKTIEEGLYGFPYQATQKRLSTEQNIGNDMTRLSITWYYALSFCVYMMVISPIIIFIFRALYHNIEDIRVTMLYTLLPFYFPENYDTLPVYFIASTLQSFYVVYAIRNGYVVIASSFNSMQLIKGELKLLRLSVEEMDDIIQCSNNSHETVVSCRRKIKHSTNHNINAMQAFLVYFVKHHHDIYRKVKVVTKGIQMVALSINSGMTLFICTSVYGVIKRKEILFILEEVTIASTIMLCLYCYALMGEKISNENENLRRALYECAWLDKPKWFKKSLQIIMGQTTRPIEMKYAGLFVLNLRNFVSTVRAVYSYYNVLNNL